MTDLRAALLDRIAVELHDQEGDVIEENYAVAAEFVLDAFLDTLADRADEWANAASERLGFREGYYTREALIAVLRGDAE